MEATSFGLWLAGVGACAAVASAAFDLPSRGTGGLRFDSPKSARPERLRHAGQAVGLAFVAVGSAVVAAAELPAWWIAAASGAVFVVAFWLVCAWSQHRVWTAQQPHHGPSPETAEKYPMEAYARKRNIHCARWRWALLHPFNGETWPKDFTRRHARPNA